MKLRLVFIINLLATLLACNSNSKQNIRFQITQAMRGTITPAGVRFLYVNAEEAIDTLLADITSTAPHTVGCVDPKMSIIPSNIYGTEGEKALQMIEWLIGIDSSNLVPCKRKVKVCNACIIIKSNNLEYILRGYDLQELKNVYSEWWKKQRKKGIDAIRKTHSPFKTILKGTVYSWI